MHQISYSIKCCITWLHWENKTQEKIYQLQYSHVYDERIIIVSCSNTWFASIIKHSLSVCWSNQMSCASITKLFESYAPEPTFHGYACLMHNTIILLLCWVIFSMSSKVLENRNALDSRSKYLCLRSHCLSCVEVSDKLIPYCLCLNGEMHQITTDTYWHTKSSLQQLHENKALYIKSAAYNNMLSETRALRECRPTWLRQIIIPILPGFSILKASKFQFGNSTRRYGLKLIWLL